MVAYLMRGADVAQYNLIDRINAEEILLAIVIDLDGPEPVARVRIYKLFNPETGEDFGVAEDRVYGARVPDFTNRAPMATPESTGYGQTKKETSTHQQLETEILSVLVANTQISNRVAKAK